MNVTRISTSQLDKSICDGFGCYETATTEITATAGHLGTINLNLCEKCVPRFGSSIIHKKVMSDSSQTPPAEELVKLNVPFISTT